MDTEQAEIYRRIETYPLDDPGAAQPFSARLARENGWSQPYVGRVIAEYKRFVFLAMVAGHTVTPSEQVDQAWHLHITYTRTYWNEFCGEVLGRPLHHDPTKGGTDERDKHYDLYNWTLDSYRAIFGEEPPADIWPDAYTRFEVDTQVAWINTKQNWVISKASVRRGVRNTGLIVGVGLLMTACAPAIGITNPFDLYGPDFLVLYVVVFGLALLTAGSLRWLLPILNREPMADYQPNLSLYEVAFLNGGAELAADTAVTRLIDQNHLSFQADSGLVKVSTLLPANAHPIEQAIYSRAADLSQGISVGTARDAGTFEAESLRDKLAPLGLLANATEQYIRVTLPMLILMAVAGLGGVKILVGLSRERPVVTLVILCVLTMVVAVLGFGRKLHRSRYGDAVLAQLRRGDESALLETDAAGVNRLVYSVAVLGTAALTASDFPFTDLGKALHPPSSESGGDGGCGGGCGGCGGCGG